MQWAHCPLVYQKLPVQIMLAILDAIDSDTRNGNHWGQNNGISCVSLIVASRNSQNSSIINAMSHCSWPISEVVGAVETGRLVLKYYCTLYFILMVMGTIINTTSHAHCHFRTCQSSIQCKPM